MKANIYLKKHNGNGDGEEDNWGNRKFMRCRESNSHLSGLDN